MTQKLTAQIAAAYFGCKVKVPHGESFVIGKMESVTERAIYFYQKEDVWSMGIPACQLILTRLEDITDEHAVGLFKAYHNGESITIYSKKEKNDAEMAEVSKTELVPKYKIHRIENIQKIIDYLRSKNYDCGYGSIPSLISAGIAVDAKTVNQ